MPPSKKSPTKKTSKTPVRKTKKRRRATDTVRFSTQLKWLEPYLRRAKHMMPSLVLPKHIRPFKPPKKKIMRTLGNVYFGTKTISLATHDQMLRKQKDNTYKIYRIVKLSKLRILETFAHELAHLHFPEHGYEQTEYTTMIFKTFEFKVKCPTCQGTGKVTAGSTG